MGDLEGSTQVKRHTKWTEARDTSFLRSLRMDSNVCLHKFICYPFAMLAHLTNYFWGFTKLYALGQPLSQWFLGCKEKSLTWKENKLNPEEQEDMEATTEWVSRGGHSAESMPKVHTWPSSHLGRNHHWSTLHYGTGLLYSSNSKYCCFK